MSAPFGRSSNRSPSRTMPSSTVEIVRNVAASLGVAMAAAAIARVRIKDFISLLLAQLVQRAEHFVRGLDDLGVHLVCALRGDQVGDLGDGIDVRGLEEALQHGAEPLLAGRAGDGL